MSATKHKNCCKIFTLSLFSFFILLLSILIGNAYYKLSLLDNSFSSIESIQKLLDSIEAKEKEEEELAQGHYLNIPQSIDSNYPNGRPLEYFLIEDNKTDNNSVDSNVDNNKKTVLLIHGSSTSGWFCTRYKEFVKRNNIKLICPSIPGWGLSFANHPVTLQQFTKDMAYLLDSLEIKQIDALIGVSLGGPHAAAISVFLPNRIKNLNLFIALSQPDTNHIPMGADWPIAKKIIFSFIQLPILRDLFNYYLIMPLMSSDPKEFLKTQTEDFKEIIGTNLEKLFLKDFIRSFKYTSVGTRGTLPMVLNKHWGFNVSEISDRVKGKKVISYAEFDTQVVKSNADYYAKHVKGSELRVLKKRNHFSALLDLEQEILYTLQ